MAKQLFSNNAGSMLAVSINAAALTLQVGGGHGALFPLPTGGDYFLVTLTDAAGNIEIVKCTARASDVLTIERAQEGTSAQSWTGAACRVELRNTAATLERFVQTDGDYTILGELTLTGGIAGAVGFNDAGNLSLLADNKELRFGAGGDDLAVYHDGADNYIDSNTGDLYLRIGTDYLRLDEIGPNASIVGTAPRYGWYDINADTDEKGWIAIGNNGVWQLLSATDADFPSTTNSDPVIQATKTAGVGVDSVRILPPLKVDEIHADSTALISGTYTPTLTALSNLDAVTHGGATSHFKYVRVGNIVYVAGRVSVVNPTAADTITSFGVSLPIASDFTNALDCSGVGVSDASAGVTIPQAARVVADTTNNRATVTFVCNTTEIRSMEISFMYEIM